MAISLLHIAHQPAASVSPKILSSLALDIFFSFVCPDVPSQKMMLSYLSEPLTDGESIRYRQNILRDFLKDPALLDELKTKMQHFTIAKKDWERSQSSSAREMHDPLLLTSRDIAIIQCRTAAENLKRGLLFMKSFDDLLGAYAIDSTGLLLWKSSLEEHIRTDAFSKLIALCGQLEELSIASPLDIRVKLNRYGRICQAELLTGQSKPDGKCIKNQRFLCFFKRKEKKDVCDEVPFTMQNTTLYSKLTTVSYQALTKVMNGICKQIYDTYAGVDRELTFYTVAVQYCEYLKKSHVPFVFPVFSDHSPLAFDDLYDPLLLITKPSVADIVPFRLKEDGNHCGTVVFGKNSSGKTTFLRAIGCLQILSQAGLPVPATHAQTRLYRGIYAHFAEAEDAQSEDAKAGRFEQEVRDIAQLIKNLSPNSLVLLNEIFQSTSYGEGALGLVNILDYFSGHHISWYLVTHIHQLKHLLNAEQTNVLETGKQFEIEKL